MNMHVFSLLHEDHENVALIFKKIDSMKSQETAQTHEQLFKELSTELELHAKVEEDIVYPVFKKHGETRQIVEESVREHKEIDRLLSELKGMRPDDQKWMGKLGELQRKVEHHVKEEEEQLFPQGRKIISEDQAQQLGETVENKKEELRGQRSGFKVVS
jgi:hemerythrin superfamily protein